MFAEAGVLIEFSSPYSQDLSPIEYFFGSLKGRIRKRWLEDEDLIKYDFKLYITMQINVLGRGETARRIARIHFKKAQIYIK